MSRSLTLLALLVSLRTGLFAEPQVFFSPDGGAREAILKQINLSRKTIDLAIFDFTAGPVAEALTDAAERGIKIRIVADRRQAAGKHSEVPYLYGRKVPIKILAGRGRGIMHHKFAVFDGKLVVTGSYNWTENAEHFNYENLLVEDSVVLAGRYAKEFELLWARGKPVGPEEPEIIDWTDVVMDWLRDFKRFLKVVK